MLPTGKDWDQCSGQSRSSFPVGVFEETEILMMSRGGMAAPPDIEAAERPSMKPHPPEMPKLAIGAIIAAR